VAKPPYSSTRRPDQIRVVGTARPDHVTRAVGELAENPLTTSQSNSIRTPAWSPLLSTSSSRGRGGRLRRSNSNCGGRACSPAPRLFGVGHNDAGYPRHGYPTGDEGMGDMARGGPSTMSAVGHDPVMFGPLRSLCRLRFRPRAQSLARLIGQARHWRSAPVWRPKAVRLDALGVTRVVIPATQPLTVAGKPALLISETGLFRFRDLLISCSSGFA
jgi:hypothetical protein